MSRRSTMDQQPNGGESTLSRAPSVPATATATAPASSKSSCAVAPSAQPSDDHSDKHSNGTPLAMNSTQSAQGDEPPLLPPSRRSKRSHRHTSSCDMIAAVRAALQAKEEGQTTKSTAASPATSSAAAAASASQPASAPAPTPTPAPSSSAASASPPTSPECSWFDIDTIHKTEIRALPEFFAQPPPPQSQATSPRTEEHSSGAAAASGPPPSSLSPTTHHDQSVLSSSVSSQRARDALPGCDASESQPSDAGPLLRRRSAEFTYNPFRTPQVYKDLRDFILLTYHSDPATYLHVATLMKYLAADFASVYRIHQMMEAWQLINIPSKLKARLISSTDPQLHAWTAGAGAKQAAEAATAATETSGPSSAETDASTPVAAPKPDRPAHQPALSQLYSAAADVYHFYQSSDGQQLYLHALTYRSLLLQYGGSGGSVASPAAALPARIRGRIQHLDSFVMDRSVRGGHRFLSHLPLTATFGLALLELTEPRLSRATAAAMAPEVAADRRARQTAAKRQRDLNKRTIQSSKAHREAEGAGGGGRGDGHGGSFLPEWQQDAAAFPGLAANPLGFASGAPAELTAAAASASPASGAAPASASASASSSGGSPATRVANWNVVAEKGMASSELWAPLQSAASPALQATSSHWGSAAAPIAVGKAAGGAAGGSHPPALSLGSAGWGRSAVKPPAAGDSSSSESASDRFPLPSVNRHGQTTLLSTAGRRSYK